MRTLIATLLATPALLAQGPLTWIAHPSNGFEYAVTTAMSWQQAENAAVAQGGHLAAIGSAAEESWILQQFGGSTLWIGFTDQALEGTWLWTSGAATTYTNWLPGEPNNASNEDYAGLGPTGWNDMDGTAALPGVVKRAVALSGAALWQEQFPSTAPPARDTHGMAYDPTIQRTVLCGGFNVVVGHSSDVWEWDGSSWHAASPTTSPLGRETFGFCFDGVDGILLFGGYSAIPGGPPNRVFDDTWRYSQGQWSNLNPTSHPSARRWPAMALTNQGILLFGGSDRHRTTTYGDTWLWDGVDWNQLSPTTSPPARWGHWMVYDSARDVAVLFGGSPSALQPSFADTWEFDGTTWVQRFPIHSPTARTEATMVYSEADSQTLLFGGRQGSHAGLSDTWAWDGTDWSQVAASTAPSARHSVGLSFDPLNQTVVLFGGHDGNSSLGGTFEFVQGSQASVAPFGTGCPGPNGGTPMLAAAVGGEPRLGSTATVELTGLPMAISIPVFVYGTSNTVDPGPPAYNLPVDLGPLGWPGCQQLVSDDAHHLTITNTGQMSHSIPVPMDPGLLSFQYFVQAFILYTPSGVAVSNGIMATVGL